MKTLALTVACFVALFGGQARACPPALLGAYNAYMGSVGYGAYGLGLDYGVDTYGIGPITPGPVALDYGYAPAVSYGYSAFPAYSSFGLGYGVGFNRFGFGFNRFGFNRFGFNRGVNVRVGRGFGFGRRTVVRIR